MTVEWFDDEVKIYRWELLGLYRPQALLIISCVRLLHSPDPGDVGHPTCWHNTEGGDYGSWTIGINSATVQTIVDRQELVC